MTEHFEAVNDGTLVRFQVHDWYEEETTGPSIGVYRPPIYGFERTNQVYVVYPVFIRNDTSLIGPPLIPFLPTSVLGESPDQNRTMVLKIRHFPKTNHRIEPTAIIVFGVAATTISLEKGHSDLVGTIFSAKLPISGSEPRFKITLALSDGSSKDLEFAHRRDRLYSPLFSFNAPKPRPSLKRYAD